ncbi:hypothetical protein [Caballeronia sp. Lep1P3]|uniref:hypothetical protein n=1 Tax=Caballeronia sp. Lep1P3 TaxID=2878150 RepID=UPI001FD473FC|nr:hypothetical protein [Caballeronia sp. Lep1P3]
MDWLNVIGTVAIGAVVVLAGVAVSDIVRLPGAKRSARDNRPENSRHAPAGQEGTRRQAFKRSDGTDR